VPKCATLIGGVVDTVPHPLFVATHPGAPASPLCPHRTAHLRVRAAPGAERRIRERGGGGARRVALEGGAHHAQRASAQSAARAPPTQTRSKTWRVRCETRSVHARGGHGRHPLRGRPNAARCGATATQGKGARGGPRAEAGCPTPGAAGEYRGSITAGRRENGRGDRRPAASGRRCGTSTCPAPVLPPSPLHTPPQLLPPQLSPPRCWQAALFYACRHAHDSLNDGFSSAWMPTWAASASRRADVCSSLAMGCLGSSRGGWGAKRQRFPVSTQTAPTP
jgi:hypothetical protein